MHWGVTMAMTSRGDRNFSAPYNFVEPSLSIIDQNVVGHDCTYCVFPPVFIYNKVYCGHGSVACFFAKQYTLSLTGMAQLVGHRPTKSPVRLRVKAHAWVAGLVSGRGVYRRQPINLSLSHGCFSPSFSLPSSLSKNQKIKLKKNILDFKDLVYILFFVLFY